MNVPFMMLVKSDYGFSKCLTLNKIGLGQVFHYSSKCSDFSIESVLGEKRGLRLDVKVSCLGGSLRINRYYHYFSDNIREGGFNIYDDFSLGENLKIESGYEHLIFRSPSFDEMITPEDYIRTMWYHFKAGIDDRSRKDSSFGWKIHVYTDHSVNDLFKLCWTVLPYLRDKNLMHKVIPEGALKRLKREDHGKAIVVYPRNSEEFVCAAVNLNNLLLKCGLDITINEDRITNDKILRFEHSSGRLFYRNEQDEKGYYTRDFNKSGQIDPFDKIL